MELEEFRTHAHAFSDWMTQYLATVETRPVRSQVSPGDISAQISNQCPERGEAMETIFADFQKIILPGITHWQHPRFFAYFNANSSPPSVLAEMLTATLAAQCMLWETSPAATELEARMVNWLRDLMALPGEFTGSIQDSGSASNLCGLLAGCQRATAGRAAREGLAQGPPLMVYASVEAHSSVEKGARIIGLGSDNVRRVPLGDNGGMDARALRAAMVEDRAQGRIPACVVACLGSTGLGTMDDLEAVGTVTRSEQVHLHVDGAWAGSALILPEFRQRIKGFDYVDSFVFNPHKWLFTNYDCSVFYMRDPKLLTRALSLTPAYLESESGEETPEYRDWSVALGRRFRALKLWFVLRSYGAEALRVKLRNHIAWVKHLASLIKDTDDFQLMSGPNLALLGFRYRPDWAEDRDLDALNERLLANINNHGLIYLTKTRVHDKDGAAGPMIIRFVVGQTYTTLDHVLEGWGHVQNKAQELARERSVPA